MRDPKTIRSHCRHWFYDGVDRIELEVESRRTAALSKVCDHVNLGIFCGPFTWEGVHCHDCRRDLIKWRYDPAAVLMYGVVGVLRDPYSLPIYPLGREEWERVLRRNPSPVDSGAPYPVPSPFC